jgi:mannose/cellobiose epimerase-like protein (N-acyl-D-glucosamine 2-epimerase family)
MKQLQAIADQLRDWMFDHAWPLWSAQGLHESYRFHETLDFAGCPSGDHESRVRTQARQVYSFALAYQLGWNRELAANIVMRAVPVLLDSVFREDGIAGRRIDVETGRLTDATGDLYDTAFCLMALAQSRDIIGYAFADEHIGLVLGSVDKELRLEAANGYRESLPEPLSRLQNPHMHFFESLLLILEKTRNTDILERAEELYEFINRLFFDRDARLIREAITVEGSDVSSGYDPGHSMEWVWLMGYRSRLCGCELPDFAYDLYERACEANVRYGNTRMRLSTDDHLVDSTVRLWSQTETLKGHLCIAELGRAQNSVSAIDAAAKCASDIHDYWLDAPVRGGWLDQSDEKGELVATGMPASTGYHLYLAIAELARVARKLV